MRHSPNHVKHGHQHHPVEAHPPVHRLGAILTDPVCDENGRGQAEGGVHGRAVRTEGWAGEGGMHGGVDAERG